MPPTLELPPAQAASQPAPLHLYVHIPFCLHKCHYCDFNSHVSQHPPWAEYQHALTNELRQWASDGIFSDRKLATIFFGGGTPSLSSPALIEAVIESAHQNFGLDEDIEITLEANPGAIDSDHFSGYRYAGVNRISIGVQSLIDTELHWLERIHGRKEALDAFDTARKAGFNNINLDLIYGLPDQNLDSWLDSLHAAIHMAPEHFSCYQLTVEAQTGLAARHAKRPYRLPDEKLALDFFLQTRRMLLANDYEAYEISNFSRPGYRCQHNDGYWLYNDYIGIGAGASGKWNLPDGGITRYCNIRTPAHYIKSIPDHGFAIDNQEILSRDQAAAEAVWLGLRRAEGINRSRFHKRFGFDAWEFFATELSPWHKREQLSVSDDKIYLPPATLPLADSIAVSVL